MNNFAKTLLVGAAAAALTACGGGGGGGGPSTGVTTPTPPTTTTPPPITPATLLLSPMAAITDVSVGGAAGNTLNNFEFTDPDAPGATKFAELKIDGDETVRLRYAANNVSLEQILRAADYSVNTRLGGGYTTERGRTVSRSIASKGWSNSGSVTMPAIEEGTFAVGLTTGDAPDWVVPIGWSYPTFAEGQAWGFGLLGDLATNIPTTGVARFRGEAIGSADGPLKRAGVAQPFSASAGVDIDFSTGKVRGGVENFRTYLETTFPLHTLDFNFEADLVAGKFAATSIDAPFQSGEKGGVNGQLYGQGSDLEVGATFYATYADLKLAGMFVAGRPTSNFLSGTDPTTLRPSLVNLTSSTAGWTRTSYNQNNIELGGNNESLTFMPGAFGGSDDSYRLYFDNGAEMILQDFDGSHYKGDRYVDTPRPSTTGTRYLRVETWTNVQTLNRWELGVQSDKAWIRPAYVQALEYVNAGISPGVTHRAYMTAGLRSTALPATGSARYKGDAVGTIANASTGATYTTSGTGVVDVFFGTGQVRGGIGSLVIIGQDGFTVPTPAGTPTLITFSGALNANRAFDATVDPQKLGLTGQVRGDFYGPDAAELGAIYNINLPGYGAMAGMLVGARNPVPASIGYSATTFSSAAGAANYAVSAEPLTGLSVEWRRNSPFGQGDTLRLDMTAGGQSLHDSYVGRAVSYNDYPYGVNAARSTAEVVAFDGAKGLVEMMYRVSGVDLRYASVAGWRSTDSRASHFVALGQRATDVPQTGKAEYQGVVAATYNDNNYALPTTGKVAMTVDFAAASLTGSTSGLAINSGRPDPNFSFKASIANAEFSGDFANADNTLSGPVKGLFAGPGAPEAVGTFNATKAPAGTTYSGGFVAVKK